MTEAPSRVSGEFPKRPWTAVASAVVIALGYYAGARLGFAFTLAPVPVSILWPPNSILLAGLLLTDPRRWPLVFVAVLGAHLGVQLQSGVPLGMTLCWFVSNCAEGLIGATLLRRFADRPVAFQTFRQSVVFLAAAGLAAPFFSSFLDAWFVSLNGWGQADYWTVWRTRFISNAVAEITLVPVVVTTVAALPTIRTVSTRSVLEAAAGFLTLTIVCWAAFHSDIGTSPALLYAPLPLLMVAAVRFGTWGASVAMLTCTLIAISGASNGLGPFVSSSPVDNAFSIQLFILMAWIPVMSLAAVVRERSQANARAKASEDQLAVAIETAKLGRWNFDMATGELEWSDITRRMYEVEDGVPVRPETFRELIHPDDRPLLEAALRDATEGRDIDVEFRVRFPDGRVKWIHSRGRRVCDADGRPIKIAGVKSDITERKLAELRMVEQQRDIAHSARVSVAGELSVALAHELNQPLTAILANAGAARRYLLKDPPDLSELRDIVDAIAYDNRRASEVITRFRTLLRRDPAHRGSIDVNELATAVLDLAGTDIRLHAVSVEKRFEPRLPPVYGDAVQIQQVLLNLIVNACEAMADTAGARRLTLTTAAGGGDHVRITVSDTGTGVDPESAEQIFEPFVSTKPDRIGFGLTICRSIVASHDGDISVEDGPDGGATFSFSLPVTQGSWNEGALVTERVRRQTAPASKSVD